MEGLLRRASGLLPRHDMSSMTPAEMAEMLVDPYEKSPKCTRMRVIPGPPLD